MTLACDCWLEGLRPFFGAFFTKKKKATTNPGAIPLQLEMPRWHCKCAMASLPLGSALCSLMLFVYFQQNGKMAPALGTARGERRAEEQQQPWGSFPVPCCAFFPARSEGPGHLYGL